MDISAALSVGVRKFLLEKDFADFPVWLAVCSGWKA